MSLKKNIAISDSGFVFDPLSGNSFTTNPIGLLILQGLRAGKSEKEIAEQLFDSYDAEPSRVTKDLSDFMMVLERLKLTE